MMDAIFCHIIGHRRSRRQAHRVDGTWRSRCRRCGMKLIRLGHAEWHEIVELESRDNSLRGALFEHWSEQR